MPAKQTKDIKNSEYLGKEDNDVRAPNSQEIQQRSFLGYTQQVTILVIYYFIALLFSFWFLLDIWSKNFVVFRVMGMPADTLGDPLLRTIGFSMVGGLLGSILYQIRVLFHYYAKKRYDPRWFGKYITSPLEGAGMAVVVLSLIQGGVAVFGSAPGNDSNAIKDFAAIGIGALVGFGMRDVVGWLGHLVHTMFSIPGKDNNQDSSAKSETANEKQAR